LLSHDDKIDKLIDHPFPETRNTHYIEIDQDYLNSIHAWHQTEEEIEEEVEWISNHNNMQGNHLQVLDNRQSHYDHLDYQNEGKGGEKDTPILHANGEPNSDNTMSEDNLQRLNNRQTLPHDVIEFIDLCEQRRSLRRTDEMAWYLSQEEEGVQAVDLLPGVLRQEQANWEGP
jgi:hypothetical protein